MTCIGYDACPLPTDHRTHIGCDFLYRDLDRWRRRPTPRPGKCDPVARCYQSGRQRRPEVLGEIVRATREARHTDHEGTITLFLENLVGNPVSLVLQFAPASQRDLPVPFLSGA